MNRKTVFILVVVLLLAALAGGSWWIGAQARQALADQLEVINGRGRLRLSLESYEQGIFASQASLKVDVPVAASTAKAQTYPVPGHLLFDLRLTLAHGPIPLVGGVHAPALAVIEARPSARPDSPRDLKDILAAWPEGQGLLTRMVVGLDGAGTVAVDVSPLRRTLPGDAPLDLDWKGFAWRGAFTPGFASWRGEGQSAGLELRNQDEVVSIDAVSMTTDARRLDEQLWVGESALSVGRLAATSASKPADGLAARELSTRAALSRDGDLLRFDIQAKAAGLDVFAQTFGPLELVSSLSNIDLAAFKAWQQDVNALQPRLAAMTPEQVEAAMGASLAKAAPALAAQSPVFEVSTLRAKTPDGDVDGRVKVAVINPQREIVADVLRLAGMLQAEADVSVAEKLVRKLALLSVGRGDAPTDPEMTAFAESMVDEQIEDLLKRKLLVQDGESYRTKASWKSGLLQVNGRPMPLF